jgi:hypothetical protein
LQYLFFAIYHIVRVGLGITIIALISDNRLDAVTGSFHYARVQEVLELWSKGTPSFDTDIIVDITTVSANNCPAPY